MDANLYDRIRERAYEIWFATGCRDGEAEQHWLTAEHEILHAAKRGHSGETSERQEGEPAARPRHTEGRSGQLGAETTPSPCWVYRPKARR